MNHLNRKIILGISLSLALLVSAASIVALFTENFYTKETANWQVQAWGQDLIDLFLVVPCLVIASIWTYKKNELAVRVWAGILCYLGYTFAIYCFDTHFNRLFVVYCWCFGLSFYGVVYFFYSRFYRATTWARLPKAIITKITAGYFITVSVLFYVLWLSEIIPANIKNAVPESIEETGLLTNGVHVLDLSIALPAIFIIGILLLKKLRLGYLLAPVLLVFLIIMNITIGFLAVVMKWQGITTDVNIVFVMIALALLSSILFVLFPKKTQTLQQHEAGL